VIWTTVGLATAWRRRCAAGAAHPCWPPRSLSPSSPAPACSSAATRPAARAAGSSRAGPPPPRSGKRWQPTSSAPPLACPGWRSLPAAAPPSRSAARASRPRHRDALSRRPHQQLHRDLGDAAPPAATVRKTLADHPAFVQVGQGRWQLGEPAAPCRSPDPSWR
jgi:hypothetical protein